MTGQRGRASLKRPLPNKMLRLVTDENAAGFAAHDEMGRHVLSNYVRWLEEHDFGYCTREMSEAEWSDHNERERNILRGKSLLHRFGKGEIADMYYEKFAVNCTKKKFLPVDAIEPLLETVNDYKALLARHDFGYKDRPTGISHFMESEKTAKAIFELRKHLHVMGQGRVADRLYFNAAPSSDEHSPPRT